MWKEDEYHGYGTYILNNKIQYIVVNGIAGTKHDLNYTYLFIML